MKEIPLSGRDPIFARFTDDMVESLRALPYEKKTPTEQSESTKRIMSRPKEEDEAWFRRELPKDCSISQDVWNNSSEEERLNLIAARKVSEEEIILYGPNAEYKKQRNTLGESKQSSVSEEKKQIAINAYIYAYPVKEKKEEPIEEIKRSFLERIIYALGLEKPIPKIDYSKNNTPFIDAILRNKDD